MRIKLKTDWRRKFLWFPKRFGDETVFLEFVERRLVIGTSIHNPDSYEYRLVKDEKVAVEDERKLVFKQGVIYTATVICPEEPCQMESKYDVIGEDITHDMNLSCKWCGRGEINNIDFVLGDQNA